MSDGSPKVPAQASPPASATASYARIYEEQQPRLVAYARSLTRNNSWAAEDLVAEAHFRVWRRLSAGHEIENVPAYLMTTVRHLAATAVVGETRETPHDPRTAERTEIAVHAGDTVDPAEQISSVDLLVRVLGQLPERWVQALWLAEAEGQPLETVGQRIGAKQGATAVLLHRAREGMRQAFLRNQTGAPDDPACEVHWVRMPAYVRGNATPRQSERLLAHVDACDDCRGRLAVLMRANDRLPALVGPALLVFAVGGAGKFLLPFIAGSAGATAALSGQIGTALHAARQAVTGGTGGAKVPTAIAAGATVAGAALAMMLALGTSTPSPTPQPDRGPLAEAPVAARPPDGPVAVAETPGEPGGPAGTPVTKRAEQRRTDGGVEALAVDAEVANAVDSADPADSADSADSDTAVSGVAAGTEPSTAPEPAADAPDADVPAPPHEEPTPAPPAVPAPVEEQPEGPGHGAPGHGAPGHEEPSYPDAPGAGEQDPKPESPANPANPANPGTPEAEAPATPSPSPRPEPPTPTPVDPKPIEESPETPQAPATPDTPQPPSAPPPPDTSAPAPAPAPAPEPTPENENPGIPCGI
ncbi:sigma-70 family RNA polymerase sigma factor [Streptomyces sp. NPDC093591]|uniref:sigma-70 family RNA polymerase sigma factor n=1 Tax=Streptomyces sp. NPDC093591 TaxID=3366044 RepID=UPI0038080E03